MDATERDNADRDAAFSSARGQSLYAMALQIAKRLGHVDKAGKVRPGLRGNLKTMIVNAVREKWDNDQFTARVTKQIVTTIEKAAARPQKRKGGK